MNLIDSSAWLAWFTNGPGAESFREPIHDVARMSVLTICYYQVAKRLTNQIAPDELLEIRAYMELGCVVVLNRALAVNAARISIDYRLPMADAIICDGQSIQRHTLDAGCPLQRPCGRPVRS